MWLRPERVRGPGLLRLPLGPSAAPENWAAMGRPADPPVRHRMMLVRDSYGCSAPLWADVIAAIPDRVEVAYLTAKTWAADDRPR